MQVFGQIFVKRVQRHEDAQVNLAILANFCDFGVQRPAVLLIFAGFYRIRANRPALSLVFEAWISSPFLPGIDHGCHSWLWGTAIICCFEAGIQVSG